MSEQSNRNRRTTLKATVAMLGLSLSLAAGGCDINPDGQSKPESTSTTPYGSTVPEIGKQLDRPEDVAAIIRATSLMVANTVNCIARDPKTGAIAIGEAFTNNTFVGPDGVPGTNDDKQVTAYASHVGNQVDYGVFNPISSTMVMGVDASIITPDSYHKLGDSLDLDTTLQTVHADTAYPKTINVRGSDDVMRSVISGNNAHQVSGTDLDLTHLTVELAQDVQRRAATTLGEIVEMSGVTSCASEIVIEQVPLQPDTIEPGKL